MRRAGLLLAATLLLITNAVVLAGVMWNRGGKPDARVTLTERELHPGWTSKENSGMWLTLDVSPSEAWRKNGPDWFDQKKLESIGFDCHVPAANPQADLFYAKTLPIQALAVLEYDGESWKRWIAAREEDLLRPRREDEAYQPIEERRKELERDRVGHTRLFVVDVGTSLLNLRQRYSDRARFIVVDAVLSLQLNKTWDEKEKAWKNPYLQGGVQQVLVSEIHVPRGRREILDAIIDEAQKNVKPGEAVPFSEFYANSYWQGPPRFAVTLAYGRRLEPWVEEVKRLEVPPPDAPAAAQPGAAP